MPYVASGYWVAGYAVGDASDGGSVSANITTDDAVFSGAAAVGGAVSGDVSTGATFLGSAVGLYVPPVKSLRKTQYIPTRSPTDPAQVGVWATGEFERVLNGLEAPFTHELIDVLNEEPGRKLAGKVMLCFADGTNWNPGAGRGLYLYDPQTAVWSKIS